jgi:uncharacterized protein (DUF2236 family)
MSLFSYNDGRMTTVHPAVPAAGSDVVERSHLDRSFERIRGQVSDPDHGVFGPSSMMWRIVTPIPVVPLMLMEAGLLEAPHPFIADGTMSSNSALDFVPRFHRSADAFYDWFCGDLDTALRTARKIFGYHARIQGALPSSLGGFEEGQTYAANEQDTLIWVWATIIRPLKEYYEHLEGRLTAAETSRYYEECGRFALLFGIDQDRLPADWASFVAYFDAVAASPLMDVSPEFLARPGPLSEKPTGPWKARLGTTWILAVNAHRLPPKVRAQYPNLPTARRHRAAAVVTFGVLRVLWPMLPRDLRESPRCRDDWRRVGLGRPRTRLARWVEGKLPAPYTSAAVTGP